MEFSIQDNGLTVTLPLALYSEVVVYKCFYWYTGEYSVVVAPLVEGQILIDLQPKGSEWDSSRLIERIKRDLIDFRLRDIVTRETQTIRELIVAKAFAYAGAAENPVTSVSDPVGFDPSVIQ